MRKIIPAVIVDSCKKCPNYQYIDYGDSCKLKRDWLHLNNENALFDKDCPLQDYEEPIRGEYRYIAILDDYVPFGKKNKKKPK